MLRSPFLSLLPLVVVMPASGCIDEATDDLAPQAEQTDQASQEIKGPMTVASSYPEAVKIAAYAGGIPTGYCSGTVIAPRVVLTAGHCVLGASEWKVTAPHANNQVADSVKGIRYDLMDGSGPNPDQHDIGLIFLLTKIAIPQYPIIASRRTTSSILSIGLTTNGVSPLDRLYVGPLTAILDGAAVGLPLDYYSNIDIIETLDAGGPVVLPGAAPHTIVAVNSVADAAANVQLLARVDPLYSWIQTSLKPTSCGATCPNPLDGSEFFIKQLYLDVLGRKFEQAGLDYWVDSLNRALGACHDAACRASARGAIALSFLDSSENRAQYPELDPSSPDFQTDFVKHCYWNFLARKPDNAGSEYWVGILKSRGDYKGVVSGIIASNEYRLRFGAP